MDPRDESSAGAANATGPRGKNAGAGGSGKACGSVERDAGRDGKAAGREHKAASEGGWRGGVHVFFDDAGEMLTDAEEIALYVGRDAGHPGRGLRGGDERYDEFARVVRNLILHAAGNGGRERGGSGEKFGFRHNACGISEDVGFDFRLDFRQGSLDEFDLARVEF